MRNVFYLFCLVLLASSCYKEEIKPQEPLAPQPIITDTTFVDTTVSLKNTVWVISGFMYEQSEAQMSSRYKRT